MKRFLLNLYLTNRAREKPWNGEKLVKKNEETVKYVKNETLHNRL